MIKFFGISVTQQNGLLIVHTPISIMGCVIALLLAFVLLVLLAGLTDNPFRAPKMGRAVFSMQSSLLSSLGLGWGLALSTVK